MGQIFGTHDMDRMRGTLRTVPVWGTGLWVFFLALLGVAPFALFMSELAIFRGALARQAIWPAVLFLGGIAVVFMSVMRRAMAMAYGTASVPEAILPVGVRARFLVWGSIALLLVLGLWLPSPVARMITEAARVLEGS
jgi:hydrogenase-4 component F